SRQNLPALRTENVDDNLCAKGAYVIAGEETADALIFASGSEVAIAIDSLKLLAERGISGRVVSVPSLELFARQDRTYRNAVIGSPKAKVAIEAGIAMSWGTLLGETGRFVGMSNFG